MAYSSPTNCMFSMDSLGQSILWQHAEVLDDLFEPWLLTAEL